MIGLAWRHLRHHWRLNLAVLLCLTLASTLLAGFSSYTVAIAAGELDQTLGGASPAARTLLITGDRAAFSDALYQLVQDKLGGAFGGRLVIRHATSPADPQQAIAFLEVYAFDPLAPNVRLVEGRLPAQVRLEEAGDSWRPPPIEAVVGARAAAQSGYGVGDRLTGSTSYHRLDIVGIVEPLDPQADVWGQDFSAFAIATDTLDSEGAGVGLPLIVASASMRSHYPERAIFPHEVSWRISLNRRRVGVDRVGGLHAALINLQTQSAAVRAKTSTGLVGILADYLARLSRVRTLFFLLTAQTFVFVLYTLTTFTSMMIDRSQLELATLAARGASVWQITRIFALENLILALPAALLLGPGLAWAGMGLWKGGSGARVLGSLPREAWLLSGLAVGLGWLALVWPILTAARRHVFNRQTRHARPPGLSVVQRYDLDLYLLVLGGLLYWQLNRTGSFVMRRLGDSQVADPLLLLGPSLLLVGVALLFVRLLPFLMRLLARLGRRWRGLALPLGWLRLSRDPLQPGRVLLLVSLTAGLMLFSRVFDCSLAQGQAALQSDLLARGVGDAFQLNGLTLILSSLTIFFVLHWVAALGRAREVGVLRALGLSGRQWLGLLWVESLPVLLLGLLAGAVLGLGLAHVMWPFLSQALTDSLAGSTLERIRVDWPAVAWLFVQLIALYGAALALLSWGLVRARRHQRTWVEDE